MASVPSKLYSDDVSLLVLLLDANPFLWTGANTTTTSLPFHRFLTQVLSFLNSILLFNQLNQVVVIATGVNSCDFIYDSSSSPPATADSSENRKMPLLFSRLLSQLEEFVIEDERLSKDESPEWIMSSLLSGSLSLALCCILSFLADILGFHDLNTSWKFPDLVKVGSDLVKSPKNFLLLLLLSSSSPRMARQRSQGRQLLLLSSSPPRTAAGSQGR